MFLQTNRPTLTFRLTLIRPSNETNFNLQIRRTKHLTSVSKDLFNSTLVTIFSTVVNINLAMTCDFQQCGILTSVDSGEPVQPPYKLRNSKWCLASSLTVVEYSSDKQRLWSDCVYGQAGLSLCWSHIPHCWKSHVTLIIIIMSLS